MTFPELLAHPAESPAFDDPNSGIVVSSRVRLARNLARTPFPGWARKQDRVLALERIKTAVDALPEMRGAFSCPLQDLSALEKQALVERHMISREHAAKSTGSAVIINRPQNLSLMINEEDHLRMQSIRPGFQLRHTYEALDRVDRGLEDTLEFAFDPSIGYLTACPTNVGTGMRASAMLHLPALVICDQVSKVIHAVNKIGLAVRGLYGEGTEALGNLFQISNQTTLGESETEIIARLEKIIDTIIGHERNARQTLLDGKSASLQDQIGRAHGILCNAFTLTSKETLNHLSVLRLAVDLGAYPKEYQPFIDQLFNEIQPAHLQIASGRKLGVEERDSLRAEIVREKLKSFQRPVTLKPSTEPAPSAAPATPSTESHDE